MFQVFGEFEGFRDVLGFRVEGLGLRVEGLRFNG